MLGYLLDPAIQVQDANGVTIAGARLYVFNSNTSILAETYKDFEGTLNTNPVITDTLGNCTIIAEDGILYDIVFKDANDNLLFTKEDVSVNEGGSSSNVRIAAGYGIEVQNPQSNTFVIGVEPTIVKTVENETVYTPGDNIVISDDGEHTKKVSLASEVILQNVLSKAELKRTGLSVQNNWTGDSANLGATGVRFENGEDDDWSKLDQHDLEMHDDNDEVNLDPVSIDFGHDDSFNERSVHLGTAGGPESDYVSGLLIKNNINNGSLTADTYDVVLQNNNGTYSLTAANNKADTALARIDKVGAAMPQASTAAPLMNGVAAAGTSNKWAKGDHVHPTDTSREAVANKAQTVITTSTTDYPSSKAVADFVNSSIASNTANFQGNFSLADLGLTYPASQAQVITALDAHTFQDLANNDYVYVENKDPQNPSTGTIDRYKYNSNTQTWIFEYSLNNSSFTQAEMDAIDSGINAAKVAAYDDAITRLNAHIANAGVHVTTADKASWNNHVANTNIHVTSADKAAWNNHIANSNIHVTTADKNTWNAKQNAISTSAVSNAITDSTKFVTDFASNKLITTNAAKVWDYTKNKIASDLYDPNIFIGPNNVLPSTTSNPMANIIVGSANSATVAGDYFYNNTIIGPKNRFSMTNGGASDNTIIGDQNILSAEYANYNTIVGYKNNVASDYASTVVGYDNNVAANHADVFGRNNSVSGGNTIGVFGYQNNIAASNSNYDQIGTFVAGYYNALSSSADDCRGNVIIGDSNNLTIPFTGSISGDNYVLIGEHNYVSGSPNGYVVSIGHDNQINNLDHVYVFGQGLNYDSFSSNNVYVGIANDRLEIDHNNHKMYKVLNGVKTEIGANADHAASADYATSATNAQNASNATLAKTAENLPYGRASWNGPDQNGDKKVISFLPSAYDYDDVKVVLDIYEGAAATTLYQGTLTITIRRNVGTYQYNASYVGNRQYYTTMYVKYNPSTHAAYVIFNKNNNNYVGVRAVVRDAQGWQGGDFMSYVTRYDNPDTEDTSSLRNVSISTSRNVMAGANGTGSNTSPVYIDNNGNAQVCTSVEAAYATKIGTTNVHPAIGNAYTPIYVDSNGNVQQCSLATENQEFEFAYITHTLTAGDISAGYISLYDAAWTPYMQWMANAQLTCPTTIEIIVSCNHVRAGNLIISYANNGRMFARYTDGIYEQGSIYTSIVPMNLTLAATGILEIYFAGSQLQQGDKLGIVVRLHACRLKK